MPPRQAAKRKAEPEPIASDGEESPLSSAEEEEKPVKKPKKAAAPKKTKAKAAKKDDDDLAVKDDAEVDGEEDGEKKGKKVAKAKKPKEEVKPLDPSLPINLTIPEELPNYAKVEGAVRITSWNVCGLAASIKKGCLRYIAAEDADIVILTETRSADNNNPELTARYPHRYFGVDPNKKGYCGTAVLSKLEPMSVVFGLPTLAPQEDSAGRIVILEFANSYVVGTYVPNAGEKLKTLDRKEAWNTAFETYLRELDLKKTVIWAGDINCVQGEKDIRNWKTNYNKSAGCTDTEINALKAQMDPPEDSGHKKLVDVWRQRNPDAIGCYTYFSYRFQCRRKGIGWRIDSFLLSERLVSKVKACEIRYEIYGASDHVPVMLDIEGPL